MASIAAAGNMLGPGCLSLYTIISNLWVYYYYLSLNKHTNLNSFLSTLNRTSLLSHTSDITWLPQYSTQLLTSLSPWLIRKSRFSFHLFSMWKRSKSLLLSLVNPQIYANNANGWSKVCWSCTNRSIPWLNCVFVIMCECTLLFRCMYSLDDEVIPICIHSIQMKPLLTECHRS